MRAILLGLVVPAFIVMGDAAPLSGPAAGVPMGPPVIGLRVTADDNAAVRIWVRAGDRATVGIKGKTTLGLTPYLHDGWVELVIVEVADDGGAGGESLDEVGRVRLEPDVAVRFDKAAIGLELAWVDLRPGRDQPIAQRGPCMTCCVICDGQRTCGCYVITECGPCCCPEACACEGSPDGPSGERGTPTGPTDCPGPAGPAADRVLR